MGEAAAEEAAVAFEAPTGWEEVKKKSGKKKAEVEVEDDAEEHSVEIYVERKHFGTIIGPGTAARTSRCCVSLC
jgi:hypothetical protein